MVIQEPTAEELFEYVERGAYAGDESGDKDEPTGWFSVVQWPLNLEWYVITEDSHGNLTSFQCKDRVAAYGQFEELVNDYLNGLGVTCRNGCPEGYLGLHKFSCYWSGGSWTAGDSGKPVVILGVDPAHPLVCVEDAAGGNHRHIRRTELVRA